MKRRFFFAVWLFFFSLIILPQVLSVKAAHLEFDPATATGTKGSSFNVKVVVDAGSDEIVSTDAFVLFNSDVLQVDSVADGDFFPTVTYTTESSKVYIAGLVDDPASSKTGRGTLATITFKVIGDGSANVTFDCRTDASDSSKIIKNDVNATNIIVCSDNTALKYSGSEGEGANGGGNSSATTPTVPTTLPKTGSFDNLIKIGFLGGVVFIIGGVLVIFI